MSDAFTPAASIIKEEMDSEPWGVLREVDSPPLRDKECDMPQQGASLLQVKHEIDSEEHDLLEQEEALSQVKHDTDIEEHDLLQQEEALSQVKHDTDIEEHDLLQPEEALSQVKHETDMEEYDLLQQEEALLQVKHETDIEEQDLLEQEEALSQVKHEIDIEEHDLLQHPRVQAMLASRRDLRLIADNEDNPTTSHLTTMVEASPNKLDMAMLGDCAEDSMLGDCSKLLGTEPEIKNITRVCDNPKIMKNKLTTLGQLANWDPPELETQQYLNVVRIIDKFYPSEWKSWVVNNLTYEELFGRKISPDKENRIRFAIPTVQLAHAFSNKTPATLSERHYKALKRKLLEWPVTRSLIYRPLATLNKIHPRRVFSKFTSFLPKLKPHLVSREEASAILKAPDGQLRRSASTSMSSQRAHSPTDDIDIDSLKGYMRKQNEMLSRLIELQEAQSQLLKKFELPRKEIKINAATVSPQTCEQEIKYNSFAPETVETPRRETLKCNQCEYRCRFKSTLKMHLNAHAKEKPFKCDLCEYRCVQKSALPKHLRTHTGEKPFKCDQCKFRSSEKSNLKTHLRIHTGEKPYKCHLCEYRCNKGHYLKIHLSVHTGEKPFRCDHCDFECSLKATLKRHMQTHTEKKPFRCDQCKFRCKQKSNLKRHLITQHRQEAV